MNTSDAKNAAFRFNQRARAENWNAYSKPDLKFCNPAMNGLLARWHEKARHGLPKRSDFPPQEMKSLLKLASIIERIDEEGRTRWRFRLMGTGLCQMLGDFTGKHLDDVLSGEFLDRWSFVNECALLNRTHLRLVVHYALPRIDYLSGQSLVMPLADENGEARFLFSCSYVRSKLDV